MIHADYEPLCVGQIYKLMLIQGDEIKEEKAVDNRNESYEFEQDENLFYQVS